jgi:hypothetical protein
MASPAVLQPFTLLVARGKRHGQLSGARPDGQWRIGSCIEIRAVFPLPPFPICADSKRASAPSKSHVWSRRGKGCRDTSCTNSARIPAVADFGEPALRDCSGLLDGELAKLTDGGFPASPFSRPMLNHEDLPPRGSELAEEAERAPAGPTTPSTAPKSEPPAGRESNLGRPLLRSRRSPDSPHLGKQPKSGLRARKPVARHAQLSQAPQFPCSLRTGSTRHVPKCRATSSVARA